MKTLADKIEFRHGATMTNRIIQSPMLTNSGLDERVTAETLGYYSARSRSAGMVIVEYTSVSPNGGPSRSWARDKEQLAIYDDSFMPGFVQIAKALKKEGNKAVLQLVHSGREAEYGYQLGKRVEVPTEMEFPWINYPLHELTEDEVWQIVKDFGAATKRAIDCGFDGVEIHGANHYLMQEFFSAYSNKRTDYWGGSLEKRMNFSLEVSKEVFRVVKEYAPEDFIIGYRVSPEEIHGENIGYTWKESRKLVKKLTETFEFDYIHLSTMDYSGKPELGDSDRTIAELLVECIQAPTLSILTGGMKSVADMKDALQYADIIGLGRMTLIDPQIGWKIENGLEDEVLTSFNAESVRDSMLPQGVIELLVGLAKGNPDLAMPGNEYLETLAVAELSNAVTHE